MLSLALLVLLAGPFGLLGARHAELHESACHKESGDHPPASPCPVCQAAGSPMLHAPDVRPAAPNPVSVDRVQGPGVPAPPVLPLVRTLGSRGPPVLS
jgi:hypothetical protein